MSDGWNKLFHTADLMHVHARHKRKLAANINQISELQKLNQDLYETYENLYAKWDALINKHAALQGEVKRLRAQLANLDQRFSNVIDEDSRMMAWANEVLRSFRTRFIQQFGNGVAEDQLGLETRMKINRYLLATAMTLYEGLVLAPALLREHVPTNQRLSNVLASWKEAEQASDLERAERRRKKLESEWQALPASAAKINRARHTLITPEVSGERFRELIGTNLSGIEYLLEKDDKLALKASDARYEWAGRPAEEDPLFVVLNEDFLSISQVQLT